MPSDSRFAAGSENGSLVVPCPVERAIQVIGGKWKLLVLRALLLNGPQRYNELLASVTGISAKELTRNLRELTASGLIARGPDAAMAETRYALTPLGEGLMPTFQTLLAWGQNLL
jgi:DNA-binding HxlR family transcriptional regulator